MHLAGGDGEGFVVLQFDVVHGGDGAVEQLRVGGLSDFLILLCDFRIQNQQVLNALDLVDFLKENLSSVRRTLVYDMDQDFEDEIEYAFKVPKGTRIYVQCSVSVQASIRLYNKENNVTLRSWSRKKELDDSAVASATAIYILKVKAKGEHTLSLEVTKNLISIDELDKDYELPEDEE